MFSGKKEKEKEKERGAMLRSKLCHNMLTDSSITWDLSREQIVSHVTC